jgi:hypothetical protein
VPAKVMSQYLTGQRACMTYLDRPALPTGGLVAGGLFGAIISATRPEIAR